MRGPPLAVVSKYFANKNLLMIEVKIGRRGRWSKWIERGNEKHADREREEREREVMKALPLACIRFSSPPPHPPSLHPGCTSREMQRSHCHQHHHLLAPIHSDHYHDLLRQRQRELAYHHVSSSEGDGEGSSGSSTGGAAICLSTAGERQKDVDNMPTSSAIHPARHEQSACIIKPHFPRLYYVLIVN